MRFEKWIYPCIFCSYSIVITRSKDVVISHQVYSIMMRPNSGCLQGWILSHSLWCLVMDIIIRDIRSNGVYAQRYADDVAIVVQGHFPFTILGISQSALCIVKKCCNKTRAFSEPHENSDNGLHKEEKAGMSYLS